MRSRRLPEGPYETIDRSRPIAFSLDGSPTGAFEGDTIGSAMAASGIGITSRSFKYHRPRGLLCMTGSCSNCLVEVDGVPNVRACTTPVRDGVRVVRQNGWPSVDRDVLRVLDRLSFLLPPGFYYKAFHRPRWLWPLVEPIVRGVAGLGRVPREIDHGERARITLHPDVLVVGGGPAGLVAAAEAAVAGAETVLVEQERELGGRLRGLVAPAVTREPGLEGLSGHQAAGWLAARAGEAGVLILTGTAAFGAFDGRVVAAAAEEALYRIRPQQVVFATGSVEQPAVFPNNDLPGVMLSTAVQRLLGLYRVSPGRRAVVLAVGHEGYAVATALLEAGTEVTVVDPRPGVGPEAEATRSGGARVITGCTVLRAEGRRHVRAAVVGSPGGGGGKRLACDLLVVAGIEGASTGLPAQAGAVLAFDERAQAFLPVEAPKWMHCAGAVSGARSLDTALAQGRLAGREAAAGAGRPSNGPADRLEELRARAADVASPSILPPEVGRGAGKQFACLCMDVTEKEVKGAVAEGFDSMELLKRYTTMTMGPCQGRACMLATARLCARSTGLAPAETRATTARPPWTPVTLGVLASDRLVPRRETSIHDCHGDLGAEFMWAGEWRRPHHYVEPAEECEAVRERVGVIDVSTLGKFRVKGPEAVDLLERLYPSRFADLEVGRIRYAAMLNDEGVILDDGTVCRLTDDEFFVTVTTGGTAAIERWIAWWLADWGLNVQVLNVTGAYAAVNVAGPSSRTLLERLTDLDVSPGGLPYLWGARGEVAGVPSLILRLGFVGELGYEVHFPSACGEHVWERILEAGVDLGIAPFGLEAQRVLRLEKGHILVGQDTDAESDPYEAGLSWMVKLEKPDFLGRRALEVAAGAGPAERLVGFVAPPSTVPPEGAAVVDGRRWVGRVTSARRSGTAGRVIGLCWVPAAWADEGHPIEIVFDGSTVSAAVTLKPSYDPEGARLRS